MSLLILGSTGTLGRQITRKALDEGFQVKCFVRNFRRAVFLKEWGAELIYGDLKILDTIPRSLYGVTAIIDASTARPMDFSVADIVELESKKVFIRAAQLANIRRYVFFSIVNAESYQDIPLMKFKVQVQSRLLDSRIGYTIFYLYGFFQGVIHQYAIPILEKRSIWTTERAEAIPYIDTQDIAKFAIKSLSIKAARNNIFYLSGRSQWTSLEIIELCEKLSGQKSKISKISIFILRLLRKITRFFQWTWSISERLAFANILVEKQLPKLSVNPVFDTFQVCCDDLNSLDNYLQDYFSSILQRMKQLAELQSNTDDLNTF